MKCALIGCKKQVGRTDVVITANKVSRTFCDQGHALIYLAHAERERLWAKGVNQIPPSWPALDRSVIGTRYPWVVLSDEEKSAYWDAKTVSSRYFAPFEAKREAERL